MILWVVLITTAFVIVGAMIDIYDRSIDDESDYTEV